MVKKADGSWQPCRDFWGLNLVMERDVYPLPNRLNFAAKAARCTVFSKIGLQKGNHQIPVNPEDVLKTAITTTPFDLFEDALWLEKCRAILLEPRGQGHQGLQGSLCLGRRHQHLQQEPWGACGPRAGGHAGPTI